MKKPLSARCFIDVCDSPGKQAILSASLGMFVRNGIDGTSIRDIATESGYTNPVLFKHFDSKDALAQTLFINAFKWIYGNLPPLTEEKFLVQMEEILRAYLALLDEDIEVVMFFQENLRRFWPTLSPVQRKHSLLAHMTELINVGVRQNTFPPSNAQRLIVTGILGLLGQFAREFYFGDYGKQAANWLPHVKRLVMGMVFSLETDRGS